MSRNHWFGSVTQSVRFPQGESRQRNVLRGFGRSSGGHGTTHPYRPVLEALEDRLAPALVYWTNAGGDGLASNPLNWSGDPTDNTVVFDAAHSNTAITIDVPVGVAAVQIENGYTSTITLSASSLSVAGNVTQSSAATVDLGGGFVAFGGDVNVTAGTLTAPSSSGYFTVSGNWKVSSAAVFDHNGGSITFNKTTAPLDLDSGGADANHDFNNVVHDGTAMTLGDPLLVAGHFYNDAGAIDLAGNNVTVLGSAILTDANVSDTVGGATFSGDNNISVGSGTVSAVLADGPGATFGAQLYKFGSGTVIVTALNTFTGVTVLQDGTLSINSDAALGGTTKLGPNSIQFQGFTSILQTTGTFELNSGRGIVLTEDGSTGWGTIDVSSGTLTYNGVIADSYSGTGTGDLIKSGAGTLVLGGANTYTGTTTIYDGTLSASNVVVSGGSSNLGNAESTVTLGWIGTTGTLSYTGSNATFTRDLRTFGGGGSIDVTTAGQTLTIATGSITAEATLTVGGAGNTTISSLIGSGGGLTKTGTGTLTLSGANSYSGVTTLLAGTLTVGSHAWAGTIGALGNATSAVLVGDTSGTNAANLVIGGDFIVGRAITVQSGSSGTKTLGGSAYAYCRFDGVVTLNDSANLAAGTGATVTVAGKLTGTGGITKTGIGTAVLSANTNDYAGTTTVSFGTLQLGASNVLPNTTGVTVTGGGTLDLATFSDTVAAAHLINGSITGTGTLTSTTNFDVQSGSVTAKLAGAVGLTKTTAGTVTLSSDGPLYTGPTTVSQGTLANGIANALPTGTALVISGGTYDLAGFSQRVGSLSDGGSAGGTLTNSGAAATFTDTDDGTHTYSGLLTGNLGFTLAGSGGITLSGANSYTGVTTVLAGTLTVGADAPAGSNGALGNATSAVLVGEPGGSNDAYLMIGGAFTVGRDITVRSSSGRKVLGSSTASPASYDGVVTLSDTAVLGAYATGGTVAFNGKLTGSGGITVSSGVVTLTNTSNNYSGWATTVQLTGTLRLGASNVLPNSTAVYVSSSIGAALDLGTYSDTVSTVHLVDGSITGSGTLTSTGGFDVQSGSVTANLAGDVSLDKTTAGTVTLSGTNSYTGSTTITLGTLEVGRADALPTATTVYVDGTLDLHGHDQRVTDVMSLAGTGVVTSSSGGPAATFTVHGGSSFYNGTITGNLNLTISGAGTFMPQQANSYTGATAIDAGSTVYLLANDALPSSTALAVDGELQLNAHNLTVAGLTGTGTVSQSAAGAVLLTVNNAGSDSFGGIIAGTNLQLAKTGAGTLTLTGTNFYGGTTTVSGGTLQFGASNVLSDSTSVTIDGGAALDLGTYSDVVAGVSLVSGSITGSGTLTSIAAFDVQSGSVSANLAGWSLDKTTAGTVTLSGTNTYAGPTSISGGTMQLGASNVLDDSSTISIDGGATFAIAGYSDTVAGVSLVSGSITGSGGVLTSVTTFDIRSGSISAALGGTVGLDKSGTGTVTLSGANTYGGTTTVNAGTLQLASGSIAGDVSVNAYATLAGTGTVSGTVTAVADATVAPDIGTLNVGGMTLPTASTFRVTLDAAASSVLNGTGVVDISGSTLSGSVGATVPDIGTAITIISAATVTGRFAGLPDEGDVLTIGTDRFQISYHGGAGSDVTLTRTSNAATHFGITAPVTSVVGSPFAVTVSALDEDGTPTEAYGGTVTLSATGVSNLPLTHTFVPADHGRFTFMVTLGTAGGQVLTASDEAMTLPEATTTVQVASDAGVATQLLFRQPPTSTFVGTVIKPAVTVVLADQYGNAVCNINTGSVSLSLLNNATGAILGGTTTAKVINGVATFSNLTVSKASGVGGYQLIAASGLYPSAVSGSFDVYAKTTTAFRVAFFKDTTTTASTRAGDAFIMKITPLTALGAIDTSYRGTVRITSSDPKVLPLDYTFDGTETGGIASVPVTLKTAGARTVTAKEVQRGITASKSITVTAAATHHFTFTGFATPTVPGMARSFTLTAVDEFGNLTSGYTGTVHFSSSDPAATLPVDTTFTAANAGKRTFSAVLKTAGAQTITATDTGTPAITTTQDVAQLAAAVTPTFAGTTASVPGQAASFTFTAVAGVVPATTKFTYAITWGDGVVQTLTSKPSTLTVTHTYTKVLNPFTVKVTVTDPNLKKSTATPLDFQVKTATLQPDPLDPAKTALLVGGTNPATGVTGNDTILVATNGANIDVTVNGVLSSHAIPSGHVLVFGQGGNDIITAAVTGTQPIVVDGGAGNDTINLAGSAGYSILLGQAGTDSLTGGSGRDILIGGLGADTLHGGGADDVLIGGTTGFDANLAALAALMDEWGSEDSYSLRIGRLYGSVPGGRNGSTYLNLSTVKSDLYIDQLFAEGGDNWLWYTSAGSYIDRMMDFTAGQVATALPK